MDQSEDQPVLKRKSGRFSRYFRLTQATERIAVLFIAALLLGIVLYHARTVMVPIVAAIVIGSTIGPYVDYAERHGFPPFLLYIVLTILLCLIPYLAVISLSSPVTSWIARAPELGTMLESRLNFLERPLSAWREVREALQDVGGEKRPEIQVATTTLDDVVTGAMMLITPAIGQLLVFLGALIFFLSGRRQLRQWLTMSFADRGSRLRTLKAITDIETSLTTLLTSMAVINLGVGLAVAVLVLLFGVANPVMWGLAAFVCNFIPYIGPLVLTAVFFFVGLLTFDNIVPAVLLPLAYMVIVAIETQFVSPSIMSRRLEMNTFLVFVGIVFWSWMWGIAGAFLALPLLIAGNAVVRQICGPKEKDVLP
jgi:predicted PurR-regulated permease PerM